MNSFVCVTGILLGLHFLAFPCEVPPVVTRLTSRPEKAVVGEPVTIICDVNARPAPSYAIFHNNTMIYNGAVNTYTIPKVKFTHAGFYECIIENKIGSGSRSYKLTVVEKGSSTLTPPPKSTSKTIPVTAKDIKKDKETSNNSNCSGGGTKWYIFLVLLVSGIIIGITLSYIFVYSRRRFRNRKPKSNPEPNTSEVHSIYQDLDLSKMNSEDNYQSLRVNSDTNETDHENQHGPTYTDLNTVRGVEDNYQSLT